MSHLTTILDRVASELETRGLKKLATELDVVANTIGKEAYDEDKHSGDYDLERNEEYMHKQYSYLISLLDLAKKAGQDAMGDEAYTAGGKAHDDVLALSKALGDFLKRHNVSLPAHPDTHLRTTEPLAPGELPFS